MSEIADSKHKVEGSDTDHDPGGPSTENPVASEAGHSAERKNETIAISCEATAGETVHKTPESAKKTSFCKRLINLFSLTKEGATPMNWKVLSLILCGLFGSCYSITFLFPFLPDMVLFFGYKEEEKGYFVGLVASAMFAGRIFGSYFWGWLSDVRGRRPVVLICLVFIMLSNLAFGFSVNIYMAIALRFLCGLTNGVVGTSKTVIYEISDNTNQALGMSTIALAWGAGIIIGPLLSGYLAEPATKYPSVFSDAGVFGRFPYLLPSLVATFMCLVPLILLAVFLPETLNAQKSKMTMDVKADEGLKREENASLLEREKSQSSSHLQHPSKALVNRQLSRVKQSDMSLNNRPAHSTGNNATDTPPKDPSTFAPSIMSLDYVDSGRPSKHEGVGVYGYGCIVTSQGDLLLPDLYSSQSSGNTARTFDRQYSSRSDSGVLKVSKNLQKRQLDMSSLASSQGNVNSAEPLQDTGLPNKEDQDQMQFRSLPDVAYKPNEKGNKDMVILSPKEGDDKTEDNSSICCQCWRYIKNLKMIQLMKYPNVRNSVLIYTFVSFSTIGFDDVFTVWASTDKKYFGLEFSSEKIGAALGLSSAPLLLLQVFLFSKLEARFGAKKVFLVFCMVLMANCIAIPSLRILRDQTVPFWILLLILMAVNKIAQTTCFSANGLHINNSVPANFAGSVNGLAMTYTAIGRTIAPTLGGSIFAWSIVHGAKIGFPLDVNLVFILFSFIYLVTNIMCARLPESLNHQSIKEQENLEEQTEQ